MNIIIKIINICLCVIIVLNISACDKNEDGIDMIKDDNSLLRKSFKEDGQLYTNGEIQYPESLWQTPIYEIADGYQTYSDNIKAVFFNSVEYEERTLKVFAYIGFPEETSKDCKVPGVVCVHGGGGTAYIQWVKEWNDRGYAAIAIDTEGGVPDNNGNASVHLENGGKARTSYSDQNDSIEDQWMYQATAAVICANSLLRSFDNIDKGKIGITGVSWGAVIMSIVLGYDDRYSFGIPVYGCLSLDGTAGAFGFTYNTYKRAAKLWDTIKPLSYSTTPVLWINGDLDVHFTIDATTRCYMLSLNNNFISIRHNLEHSHQKAWNIQEVYAFANSICKNDIRLVRCKTYANFENDEIEFDVPDGIYIETAKIYYNYNESLSSEDVWYFNNVKIIGNKVVNISLPNEANSYYVEIIDNRGYITSSNWVKR
jgi:dienelactone hydrolase